MGTVEKKKAEQDAGHGNTGEGAGCSFNQDEPHLCFCA